jgi:hypothetical protein
MSEHKGIALELAEKRAAIASRMSPAARARAFPKQFAKPVPVENDAAKLRNQLLIVQGKLDDAKAEIARLSAANAEMRRTLSEIEARGNAPIVSRTPTINNVIRHFVYEYNALAAVDNRVLLDVCDLLSPRTNRFVSWARHVCMGLCKELCKGASLPTIGRAFGGKDHTSVMYAVRMAPERVALRPDLALVAYRVRAHFAPMMAEAA